MTRTETSAAEINWSLPSARPSPARSQYGRALLRKRGQHIERSFAHVLGAGGMRRTTLRGTRKFAGGAASLRAGQLTGNAGLGGLAGTFSLDVREISKLGTLSTLLTSTITTPC